VGVWIDSALATRNPKQDSSEPESYEN
jgi:hypothetical protein